MRLCHPDSVIIRLNVPYPVAIACLNVTESNLEERVYRAAAEEILSGGKTFI